MISVKTGIQEKPNMKKLIILLIFLSIISCDKIVPKKGFDESKLIKPELIGEYHRLGTESMKIFLPHGFRELNDEEALEFIKKIKDDKIRYYYEKSYEIRRFLQGNFYSFYGEEYASEVLVHTLPYIPFNKNDAAYLLAYLKRNFEKYQRITGVFHNKIKATYSANGSLKVFKAIFRLTRFDNDTHDENYEMFKTVYLITINKKTFSFTILTPEEVEFDPFIRKFKL